MFVALITIAVILILYGAVSKRLDARGITSAMIFTAAGLCVGTSALKLVNIHLESLTAERICELALVFLLFSDATRIDLAGLRRHLSWPSRLLCIGLPLTILAGLGAGVLVFPSMALASAFVLSTMVCSTDAALGQRVVSDQSVPARVRQALDVESGLNDGLGVPFFLVAVDLSLAQLSGHLTAAVVRNMAEQIGWGLAAGLGAGALAGLLLRVADDRGWLEGQWRQILPLAGALLAYLVALKLGGSGFIAAFTGGMTFGYFSRRHDC
jgi:NhaP-type Na+/H+ or K+/H+ antiporter